MARDMLQKVTVLRCENKWNREAGKLVMGMNMYSIDSLSKAIGIWECNMCSKFSNKSELCFGAFKT